MNKKGFTLIELLIVGLILGIFAWVIVGMAVSPAHGLEINKLLPADNATITDVVRLLRQDPNLHIIIMVYSDDWIADTVAPLIKESKTVFRTLIDRGVLDRQIVQLFANKGGLSEDPLPTPATEGLYLYLD